MGNTFDWKTQLVVGSRGEELILANYHEPLVIYPENKADFRRLSDRKLVELKSDSYNLSKTEFMFFERFSDITEKTAKKAGGPWRARRDRVGVFVYYFARHNTYYNFEDVKGLCARLDKLTKKQGLIAIKNRAWITGGYKVRRDLVEDLATIHVFDAVNHVNKVLTPDMAKCYIESGLLIGLD